MSETLIRKFVANPFRLANDEGFFSAVISTTDVDLDGDRVLPDAKVVFVEPMPLLDGHDADKQVGAVTRIDSENGELIAHGRIFDASTRADVQAEKLQLSIGFKGDGKRTSTGVDYETIDLREVSVTDNPANTNTRFIRIKSKNGEGMDESKLAEVIENALKPINEKLQSLDDDNADKFKSIEVNIEKKFQELEASQRPDKPEPIEWKELSNGESECVISMKDMHRRTPDALVTKDITTIDATPGRERNAVMPWSDRYFEGLFDLIDVKSVGAPQTADPKIDKFTVSKEASLSSNPSYQGAISANTVTNENRSSYIEATDASLFDIPSLREKIVMDVQAAFRQNFDTDIVALLQTSALLTGGSRGTNTVQIVRTGESGALPTTANVWGHIRTIKGNVPSPYRPMSSWVLSRGLETMLEGTAVVTSGHPIDQRDGLDRLLGISAMPSDAFDALAGDKAIAFFGDFAAAICMFEYEPITVREYTESKPGAVRYRAYARYGLSLRAGNAVVAYVTTS